jgi:Domain of unknown function (DUF5679)
MFGRLFFAAIAAAAGYLAYRMLRGEEPPTMYPTPQPQPTPAYTPPAPKPAEPTPAASTPVQTEAVPIEVAPASPPEPAASEVPPVVSGEEGDVIEAYCASCRQRRTISGAHAATASNGRAGMRGTCTSCGASVFTFVKKK